MEVEYKKDQAPSEMSVYSHTSVLSMGQSVKSLKRPWYKRPMIKNLFGLGVPKLSLYTSIYSILLSLFTMGTSSFEIYCLHMASPGSAHYGYYIFSFDFVYIGNKHVRNILITIAVFSLIGGAVLFLTSIMLLNALRKEYEQKMIPWLVCMLAFTIWRSFAFLFYAVVNDLIFAYNLATCLFWIVFTILNYVGWVAVYSFFLELSDLTKLEDLAYLRMGTFNSKSQSIEGSCPTTPHSTKSTVL